MISPEKFAQYMNDTHRNLARRFSLQIPHQWDDLVKDEQKLRVMLARIAISKIVADHKEDARLHRQSQRETLG